MIGFAAPGWLLGLLLVPLIWYLHRSGPSLRRVPVASLELWRHSSATAAQAGSLRRPDPAWRRRAAIAVLLSLALSAPQWPQSAPPVTVWVDDSLSMRARDGERSRLEQGIALAQAAASETAARDVVVRPLSDPARSYPRLGPRLLASLQGAPEASEPRLPPPEVLRPDRVHWLVTDGADAAVNAWAAVAPIARVLQVTGQTRNVGIARLSARLQPADPGTLAIQLLVANGGDGRESRTVEVSAGVTAIGSRAISLEAGESVTLDFTAAVAASTVTARLTPADAVAGDDILAVDTASIAPLPAALDAACPDSIGRAVSAHPALEVVRDRPPRVLFDCGDAGAQPEVPVVRFVPGQPVAIDPATLAWSTAAETLQAQLAGQLPARANGALPAARMADRVLLAGDGAPLIVARGGNPRIVETTLDARTPGYETGPGLPLLVAALADTALDARLLVRIASSGRGEEASRVAPQPDPIVIARSAAPTTTAAVALTPLLLLALALLGWDALLAARRLRRESRAAPGRPA